jgi:prolyl-tRNA synthetase
MTHSDDQGLVLPPKLAPNQVVIVPIWKSDEEQEQVLDYCQEIIDELKALNIRIKLDDRENMSPGWKFNEHEAAGIPLRLTIGPRDLKNNNVELARRDTLDKNIVSRDGIAQKVDELLDTIQDDLYESAQKRIRENTHSVDSYDEFKEVIENEGGFVYAHWDGTAETEEKIKDETKATIRCIPLEDGEEGKCMVTGEPSEQKVLFARAY